MSDLAMANRGDVFDVELPLPGMSRSGLTHHAFAVSAQHHIETHNTVVLISTTTGSRNQVRLPFACYIDAAGIYTHEQGRPFETDRPITPTLLGSIPVSDLPERVGHVAPSFFTGEGCTKGFGANDALRVQLQLPGRMHSLAKIYTQPRDLSEEELGKPVPVRRLSIWSVSGSPHPWLVVSNDKNNLLTGFLNGLELLPTPPAGDPAPLDAADTNLGGGPYWLGVNLVMLGKGPTVGVTPAMLQQRLGADTLPAKSVRWFLFSAAGVGLDALGAGGLGTAAGIGLGALDTFVLDRILRGWKPNQFVDDQLREFVQHAE